MKTVLFHNPSSGSGEHSRDELVEVLEQAGHDVEAHRVPRAGDPMPRLTEAELIVIAGGDGAVGKVLRRPETLLVPCTILPLGTANNVASSLGLKEPAERLIERWPEYRLRDVDLGEVAGPWGTHRFVEGLGLGALARAMDLIRWFDRESGGSFSSEADELYRDACGAALIAAQEVPFAVRVELDEEVLEGDVIAVEVLNFSRSGPGLCLAPDADPGDGLLDVVLVHAEERELLLEALTRAAAGRRPTAQLPVHRARGLRIMAGDVPCRVDDKPTDSSEALQLRAVCGAHRVRMLAPA